MPAQKFLDQVFTNETYWINLYTDDFSGIARFDKGYEVVDLGSSTRRESGPIQRRQEKLIGEPIDYFVEGTSIYELVKFFKPVAAKCQLGLLKRNINDFKQEGAIAWLGEYPMIIVTSHPNARMYHDANGITVFSGHQSKGDLKPFIARYDYDLNQVWKKEPQQLADPKVHMAGYTGDEQGGLIELRLSDSPVLLNGLSWGRSVSLLSFMVLEADGETTQIDPKLEPGLVFTDGDFYFDFERNAVTGIGLVGKAAGDELQPDAFGYAYFQCGIDGGMTVFEHQMFTCGDIYSKEAKAYAVRVSDRTINDTDAFPLVRHPGFKAIRKDDGGFIVRIDNLYTETNYMSENNPPLARSILFFEVDPSGTIAWKHFNIEPPLKMEMVVENRTNPGIYNEYFVLKDNQLRWFNYVPEHRFASGNYVLPQEPESLKDDKFVPAIVTLDCTNGEVTGYTQLRPETGADLVFDAFFGREIPGSAADRDIFIRYTDKKKNTARFVRIRL